ncbi:cupin domain-containing protein [Algihabitans albus]|uniref:hypothetical protein n=1 Tax=Algihabitans albus TaxID=2164067 RepID=UPI0013C332AD|nr:hypothetical protein [Algihabitans albus]
MQREFVALPVIAGLMACSPLLASAQSSEGAVLPESGATMTVIPLGDALDREFRPLYDARPEGPNLLVLEGDPKNRPSLTLFRYGRDYTGSGNLHFHTHAYRLWLIEGELKHWGAGGSEDAAPVLHPGSFVHQPAGELHAANCLAERCTAYVIFDGPIETGFPEDR